MEPFDRPMEDLENAMHAFFQALKRPQRWAIITAQAGVDLDRPAGMVLAALRAQPAGWHIQDLAKQLGIEAPSVTRKTQELEILGYVRRIPDAKDRRAVTIVLTAAGEQVALAVRQAQRQMVTDALADWQADDIATFTSLLQRFGEDLIQQF